MIYSLIVLFLYVLFLIYIIAKKDLELSEMTAQRDAANNELVSVRHSLEYEREMRRRVTVMLGKEM